MPSALTGVSVTLLWGFVPAARVSTRAMVLQGKETRSLIEEIVVMRHPKLRHARVRLRVVLMVVVKVHRHTDANAQMDGKVQTVQKELVP